MGKKTKKQRQNRRYNKKQFLNVFCTQCDICANDSEPLFCYTELFRNEPELFTQSVFPRLLTVATDLEAKGHKGIGPSREDFERTFCQSGICHDGHEAKGNLCPNKDECYRMFRAQIGNYSSKAIRSTSESEGIENYPVIKRKKGGQKFVVKPYPTSFRSKNTKFEEEIERILHGNRSDSGEQDPAKELARVAERAPDKDSASGEPEVS